MNKMNEKSSKNLAENDLNFYNLLETTYCLLKAYITWISINFLRVTKIDKFINLIKLFIYNMRTRIYNKYSQRKNLLVWISSKIKDPICVTNFSEDWKDGIALCALMEALVPGSCPRFDLLNPDNAMDNLNMGLSLAKKHLGIDSPIESHEIHDCQEEAKLVYLLTRIKNEYVKMFMKALLKRSIIQIKDSLGNSHRMFESLFGDEKACFAKGMGLILGVRTRKAKFNIFCKCSRKLNLMIEISGPNNTECRERILNHNQRKRVSVDVVTSNIIEDYLSRKRPSEEVLKIPFFYEVLSDRIVVTYIPLVKGIHKLSIIWQGQHIMNSPYTVKVEDCDQSRDIEQWNTITSPKIKLGLQWPVPPVARKDSLSLDDFAIVTNRKVIKRTIVINGRQQTIEDLEDISDNTKEESQIENHFEDNDFNISKYYDKSLISKSSSNSPQLEKFVINGFNRNTNLFDIKECNSLYSEKSSDTKEESHHQSTDQLDGKQEFNPKKAEIFDELSDNLLTNSITVDSISKTHLNVSNTQPIASKPPIYTKQNVVNNVNYRSYIPVKNMIQNWEMKLTNNINEINETNIDKTLSKTQIPCILVKNRREVFEKNITSVHKSDSNESNSTISSFRNENQISSEVIVSDNKNERNAEENKESDEVIKRNLNSEQNAISKVYAIESELDIKTPESQPDSGICNHVFPDLNTHIMKKKLSRLRSTSFPNLRSLDNQHLCDKQMDDKLKHNDTQTSSISGQYIDDEIPDYSNLFLGNYVSYTGLINTEIPPTFDDINFNNFLDNENYLNPNNDHDLGIYPQKCEVFGAGAYYGQVGVKNHFVVSTKDGGRSYLAVGVQSTESDDVLEVSFASIGQNRYEVQYEVSRPGYYVIFVKWGDYNIADSPFICKVTY